MKSKKKPSEAERLREQVTELERRVRDLEARPVIYPPVVVPQVSQPFVPRLPWERYITWCGTGASVRDTGL